MILGKFEGLTGVAVSTTPSENCESFYEVLPDLIKEGTIRDTVGFGLFGYRCYFLDTNGNVQVLERKSNACYAGILSCPFPYKQILLLQCSWKTESESTYDLGDIAKQLGYKDYDGMLTEVTVKVLLQFEDYHLNNGHNIPFFKKYGMFLRCDKPSRSALAVGMLWRLHMENTHLVPSILGCLKLGMSWSSALHLPNIIHVRNSKVRIGKAGNGNHYPSHMGASYYKELHDKALDNMQEDDSKMLCEVRERVENISKTFTGDIHSVTVAPKASKLSSHLAVKVKADKGDFGETTFKEEDLLKVLKYTHEFLIGDTDDDK